MARAVSGELNSPNSFSPIKMSSFIRQLICVRDRLTRVALAIALFIVLSSKASAQVYLTEVDNEYPGTTYSTSDIETGGNFDVDGLLTIGGNMTFQNVYNLGFLEVGNLYVDVSSTYSSPAEDFSYSGSFQAYSNFSSNLTIIQGLGGAWLHASLDFVDLTYAGNDTPAFNISQQLDVDSGLLYPTLNFTGYDANTTWVWQQNGLNAMSNATLLSVQMTLSASGNLTVSDYLGNHSIVLLPEAGTMGSTNGPAQVKGQDTESNQFDVNVTNGAILFTDSANNTASIPSDAYNNIASVSLGNDVNATGVDALAIGNGVRAPYYGSVVMGAYNYHDAVEASNTTWNSGEPIFVVGNGTDSTHPSNALTVSKSGETTITGDATFNENVTVNGTVSTGNSTQVNFTGNTTLAQPQGDIPMAQYGDYH
jgi:hypothetical protein